jgi:uncharacterized protein (DUF1810 family)
VTLCWRETDSNLWYRATKARDFQSIPGTQLADLGRSSTARFYGIGSLDEARAYLTHNLLRLRLELCTTTVLASKSPSLHAIFVTPDDLKFRSCMTLFSRATDDPDNPFRQGLDRWCGGQPDQQTLALIG